nr:MAG TPA: hypothetical protein [Caudoviricetes sp.]
MLRLSHSSVVCPLLILLIVHCCRTTSIYNAQKTNLVLSLSLTTLVFYALTTTNPSKSLH